MKKPIQSIIELEKKAIKIHISLLDEVVSVDKDHIGGAYSCNYIIVVLY